MTGMNDSNTGRERLIQGALTPEGRLDVLVRGHRIAAVAPALEAPAGAVVIDARGMLLWPGLVNTHHHLAQSILKAMPAGIDLDLNGWLPAVPFAAWPHITPDTLYAAARIGFSELLRSGCTTCADHHYLYGADTSPELEAVLFQAAEETGIRFVLCRGGATSGTTHKGLGRSAIRTESLELWLERLSTTIAARHDPDPNAMRRVVMAPTSLIHSAPPEQLVTLARFAREHGLKLHSHLLEVAHDEDTAQALHGCSALEYAESVEWLGDDVWYAHLVKVDDAGARRLGRTRTGLAHCPVSNCRLGSGVAPAPRLAQLGVQVSIGVDGSASAESGSMVNELMQAWLVHRAVGGPAATRADDVLRWGTAAGADLLGLNTGRLAAGRCADLVLYDLDEPRWLGVWRPEFAPVFCGEPVLARRVMVHGEWVVVDGQVLGVDMAELHHSARREQTRLAQALA